MAAAVGTDIDSFIREQKAKLATERQTLAVSTQFRMYLILLVLLCDVCINYFLTVIAITIYITFQFHLV